MPLMRVMKGRQKVFDKFCYDTLAEELQGFSSINWRTGACTQAQNSYVWREEHRRSATKQMAESQPGFILNRTFHSLGPQASQIFHFHVLHKTVGLSKSFSDQL